MKILVCIKQVPDTTDIKWTENNTIQREGVESIINPFDLYAIEQALKFKDAKITVLTMGPMQAVDILKKAIAKNKEDIAKLEVRISKPNVNLYSRISKEIDECYERINFEEEELEHYQYLYNKFAFCSSIINNESNLENYELIYTKS